MAKLNSMKPSALEDHLGYWLRMISNNVSFAFSRKLEASSVTVAEWVILREMHDVTGSVSPSEISEATGLTRGAVSKLMTRLLRKKLIARQEAGADRRYQDIQLTAAGKSLVPQLARLADNNDAEFFSCLSKNERMQIKKILQKIAEHHHIKTVPVE